MEVIYKTRAAKAIDKVVDWLDAQNTEGSGVNWFERLDDKIQKLAHSKVKLAVCKNPLLARFSYRCFTYNNWIVAYRITAKHFEVCRFIWGAKLNY